MPRATSAECHCAYIIHYTIQYFLKVKKERKKRLYRALYIQHPYMLSFRLHRVWIEWAVGGEYVYTR